MYSLEVEGVGVDWVRVVNTWKSDARQDGERGGHSCPAFTRAGLGYLYIKSESLGDNIRYAEKRVKWEKGKENVKVKLYWQQTAWHCMQKGSPVIKWRVRMNVYQRCDSRRRVEGTARISI